MYLKLLVPQLGLSHLFHNQRVSYFVNPVVTQNSAYLSELLLRTAINYSLELQNPRDKSRQFL